MPPDLKNPSASAAIYARYSSDNQSEASIEDQIRVCRRYAELQGFAIVAEYADAAVSGASTLRPGYQGLLEAARKGAFNIVLAEALDRLSRDLADVATLYKHLAYLGIGLWTVAEGEITELHVGLKGTMNALYLKDLAQKTHRGLEGRVRSGMSGGGLCYGYDLVAGQTGARRIDQAEARVVRRIFEEYAAGRSPRKIAMQLNKEGMPGPFGRPWRDTAIRGHITRGTGILNNELYVGRLVWNRQKFVKDPATGRRRSRRNSPERLVIEEVPDLRIVDDELWDAVKRRQTSIRESEGVSKARTSRFWERRAQHLLSGLVHCGACGSRMAAVGRDYLACSAARGQGTCSNRKGVRRAPLEELILDGLRQRLMAPEMVEEFVTAFHEEVNCRRRHETAARAGKERELAEVTRKLDKLIEALIEGYRTAGLQQRLDDLEARKAALEQDLAADPPPAVRLHPNLAQVYRAKVERLHEALADPALRDEALGILRGLIERVVIHPVEDGLQVELVGEIVRLIELGLDGKRVALSADEMCSVKVVAGPTTNVISRLSPRANWSEHAPRVVWQGRMTLAVSPTESQLVESCAGSFFCPAPALQSLALG
jgi:site-specific DNA recombinase